MDHTGLSKNIQSNLYIIKVVEHVKEVYIESLSKDILYRFINELQEVDSSLGKTHRSHRFRNSLGVSLIQKQVHISYRLHLRIPVITFVCKTLTKLQ